MIRRCQYPSFIHTYDWSIDKGPLEKFCLKRLKSLIKSGSKLRIFIKLEYQVQEATKNKMKIFALTIAAVMAQGTRNNPQPIGESTECWSCQASSMQECGENGRVEQCHPKQSFRGRVFSSSSCQTTIRKREGEVYFVSMGCAETRSCVMQWVSDDFNQRKLTFLGMQFYAQWHQPSD